MTGELLVVGGWLLTIIVPMVISGVIGRVFGFGRTGFWWGALLGPLGWGVAFALGQAKIKSEQGRLERLERNSLRRRPRHSAVSRSRRRAVR